MNKSLWASHALYLVAYMNLPQRIEEVRDGIRADRYGNEATPCQGIVLRQVALRFRASRRFLSALKLTAKRKQRPQANLTDTLLSAHGVKKRIMDGPASREPWRPAFTCGSGRPFSTNKDEREWQQQGE